MTEQRFDTVSLRDDDEIKEVILDSGIKIGLRVADARRAPGGWKLASAKGSEMMEVFERFFSALIIPPENVTIKEVFDNMSIGDAEMLAKLVVPFLAQQAASTQLKR